MDRLLVIPAGPGVWNATQDLQTATIDVSTLAKTGLKISTSSFIATNSNVMVTSLTVSEDTTLSFTRKFTRNLAAVSDRFLGRL